MKTIFLVLALIGSTQAFAKEQWFCTDDQAMRQGNTLSICGVGTMTHEGPARELALKQAVGEFETICNLDSDCKGHKIKVEPKRSTCYIYNGRDYTCHRLFIFTIDTSDYSREEILYFFDLIPRVEPMQRPMSLKAILHTC